MWLSPNQFSLSGSGSTMDERIQPCAQAQVSDSRGPVHLATRWRQCADYSHVTCVSDPGSSRRRVSCRSNSASSTSARSLSASRPAAPSATSTSTASCPRTTSSSCPGQYSHSKLSEDDKLILPRLVSTEQLSTQGFGSVPRDLQCRVTSAQLGTWVLLPTGLCVFSVTSTSTAN